MLRVPRLLLFTVLAWVTAAGIAFGAEPTGTVLTVGADGVQQKILVIAPATPPIAAVVMFPGGDGRIEIQNDGAIARPGNFLIRTRKAWLAHGFLFVAVDAAPQRAGMQGDRVGPGNLHAIAAIVQAVRQHTAAPIWLLGTSAGAPAALAGAAFLPPGSIRGVVISSPVSVAARRDTVFDVALNRVAVPVLIQIHRNDGCRLTPPANAARIKAALTVASVVEVQSFTGGSRPRSGPCEAFAQHGFIGIEDQVVDAAASWIKAH